MRGYDNFEYHDRTIEQLKNSGNFRLIRNRKISDALIDYDAGIRSRLHDQEMQSNTIWQSLNFLQDRLFNSAFYKYINDSDNDNKQLDSASKLQPDIIQMRKGREDDLFEYYNRLEYFKQINEYRNYSNKDVNRRAVELIDMLKNEYHLK